MNYGKSLGQYNKTNVETAGNMDLVIMCYEKAVQSLNKARTFGEDEQHEEKAKMVQKVMDIINELQGCLNFENGGQIAKNLDAIYSYLTRRLIDGEVHRDITSYEEVAGIMTELKEAWAEIALGDEDEISTIADQASTSTNATQIAA